MTLIRNIFSTVSLIYFGITMVLSNPMAESDPQYYSNAGHIQPYYYGGSFAAPIEPRLVPVIPEVHIVPEPAPLLAPVASIVSTQYHAQDEYGQYSYGFQTPNSKKVEIKSADGVVKGSYSYASPDGKIITNNYVSDATGFHSSLAPKANYNGVHNVPPAITRLPKSVASSPNPPPVYDPFDSFYDNKKNVHPYQTAFERHIPESINPYRARIHRSDIVNPFNTHNQNYNNLNRNSPTSFGLTSYNY